MFQIKQIKQVSKLSTLALIGTTLAMVAKADSVTRLENLSGSTSFPRLSTVKLINGGEPENEGLKRFLLQPAANKTELAGRRIAILSTDGVEEVELNGPINYLKERGATVELVSPKFPELPKKYGVEYPEQRRTHILTARFMENATWVKIDRFLEDAKVSDYDAVLIPGGAWNPDTLRGNETALNFVRAMDAAGKTIAAICHGPLVLVSAGLLKDRTATAYWSVQLDLKNAGAKVIDEAVAIDGNLITSRFPYDLPQLMQALSTSVLKTAK